MTEEKMIACALEEGFHAAAVVDTKDIVFESKFRTYCEANLCGQYGANYSCPPDCGTPEEMKQRILAYKNGLVLQTLWEIPDFTDAAEIKHAKESHNAAALRLMTRLCEEGCSGTLVGVSGCSLCSPCARTKQEPCQFPDLRFSCMSAYCIFVKELVERCGMEYDCGKGRVAFFGMFVNNAPIEKKT